DHVGLELVRHRQRLAAGRSRPDHLDVALEAEELGEVVASLRDVVHDQDADLVGHQSVGPVALVDGWVDGALVPESRTGAGPEVHRARRAAGSGSGAGEPAPDGPARYGRVA